MTAQSRALRGRRSALIALSTLLVLVSPFIFSPGADDRSEPEVEEGLHVTQVVIAEVDATPETFSRWLNSARLEDILPGSDMVPRVVGTEPIQGIWGRPGAQRRVLLADGSSVIEEIETNDPPGYFAYKVWGMSGPSGRLIQYVRGEFFISQAPDGRTRVEWRYSFKPRSPLGMAYVALFSSFGFRPFLESGVSAIKRGAEESQRRTSQA
jgi:hypothetical protein